MPSQDQIAARYRAYLAPDSDDAFFGWRREVLFDALDYDHAKPFMDGELRPSEWPNPPDLAYDAREYLAFAIRKMADHRGISANRSVDKLREYAWLLDRDDVVASMDEAPYIIYGAPKVRAFALGMGWPWPADDRPVNRMAQGLPCRTDCREGCQL